MKKTIQLGVNIDHVATLRNARGTPYPSPILAAQLAEQAGADVITLHLREDRRHIREEDVKLIRELIQTQMNLEMALTPEMLAHALEIKPHQACFVPERREEITTEGGLNLHHCADLAANYAKQLSQVGASVSVFIDPDPVQVQLASELGVPTVELHTGCYANATTPDERMTELTRLKTAIKCAIKLGLTIHAGHGLNYHNVQAIAELDSITELNIGHAIIAQSMFIGLSQAVKEMKQLINTACG